MLSFTDVVIGGVVVLVAAKLTITTVVIKVCCSWFGSFAFIVQYIFSQYSTKIYKRARGN